MDTLYFAYGSNINLDQMAFRCPEGMVYAFDKKSEAVMLTLQNAHIFGCDNITAYETVCPDIPRDVPPPDKVFIGGAGGNIAAVLDAALAGGSSPRVVITAVTPETLHEAMTALRERGMTVDVTQISAVRTKLVGSHRMFDAQNPVFIIEGAAV